MLCLIANPTEKNKMHDIDGQSKFERFFMFNDIFKDLF